MCDMCIPRGDTQNTDACLGIQRTKWPLGCEVPTSAVKSKRNQNTAAASSCISPDVKWSIVLLSRFPPVFFHSP